MAEVHHEWQPMPLPLDDWDLDGTTEIIQRLSKLSASDVFKSHSIYQISVGYAARGLHHKFLKQLALTGLYITIAGSFGKRNIYTDLVNFLQEEDFDTFQELFKANRDLLKARSRIGVVTSLLFSNCTTTCLECIIEHEKEGNECEKEDVINGHDWHGFTPLIAAVLAGNLPCVQKLLEKGAKIDLPSSLSGIELNRPEIDINFIEEDVSLKENIFYDQSKTALMYAACVGNLKCIEILLKYKPDLQRVCFKEMNALSYAAMTPNLQCLDLLLKTTLKVEGYTKTGHYQRVMTESNNKPEFVLKLSEANFVFSEDNNTNENFSDKQESLSKDFIRLDASKLSGRGKRERHSRYMEMKKAKPPYNPWLGNSNLEKTLYEMALPFAVIGGNLLCVELLLNHCIDLDATISGKTALMLAAERGMVQVVEVLLKNWARPNSAFERSQKETALMLASKNGHVNCVDLLLRFSANKEAVSDTCETALMYACRHGRRDCLELLLENKANIEASNNKGQTPLIIAVCTRNYECVETLLRFNANIDKEDFCKLNAPMYAIENDQVEYLELLLQSCIQREGHEKLEDAAHSDAGNDPPFVISESAKTTNNEEIETKCVEPLKTITTLCEELLPVAMLHRNKKCVDLLVPRCKDFGRINKLREESALMMCVKSGNMDLFQSMIKNSVNINSGSRSTALTRATAAGKHEFVKLLLEHGANPDIENCRGHTATIIAAKDGNITCLKLLLEHGADSNYTSKFGECALKLAAINRRSECLELLIKHGAGVSQSINSSTQSKWTNHKKCVNYSAIMCAALSENNLKCLKILSDAGSKIDIVDFYPFGEEWSSQFLKCPVNVQFLLEQGTLHKSVKLYGYETKNTCEIDTKPAMLCVKLLMEYGVFDWNYWIDDENFDKILYIAVRVGVFPTEIYHDGELYSPLLYAFMTDNENAVRFMLSNLYFSIDDYKTIISDTAFTSKLLAEKLTSSGLPSLLLHLTLQPWSIQTLCLLTISSALSREVSSKERISKVDSLPIPEKFKTLLKFKGPNSQICFSEWDKIDCNPDTSLCLVKQMYSTTFDLRPHIDFHSCENDGDQFCDCS